MKYGSGAEIPLTGVSIEVLTRLDGEHNNPAKRAVTFGRATHATDSPLVLRLYLNTKGGLRGDMYDPIFEDVRATEASNAKDTPEPPPAPFHGDATGGCPELKRRRLQRARTLKPAMDESTRTASPEGLGTGGEESIIAEDPASDRRNFRNGFFKLRTNPSSSDPRKNLEAELQLLADQLRRCPTLPDLGPEEYAATFGDKHGLQLPAKHCAFRGCSESCADDEALVAHLREWHQEQLQPVASKLYLPEKDLAEKWPDKMKYVSAYNEGISVAVRRGAPIASLSIDRRALYNYTEALNDATVASLICWCCARRFPYVEARRANEIEWTQPLQQNEKVAGSPWQFARMSMKDAERIFGLGAYLERYGDREAQAGAIYARREAECEEWTMEATWPGGKCSILGCPEDKVCKDAECMEGRRICSECKTRSAASARTPCTINAVVQVCQQ